MCLEGVGLLIYAALGSYTMFSVRSLLIVDLIFFLELYTNRIEAQL